MIRKSPEVNDLAPIVVGARMEHMLRGGLWASVTITGIGNGRYVYQHDGTGRQFSCMARLMRARSRFRPIGAQERSAEVAAVPVEVPRVEVAAVMPQRTETIRAHGPDEIARDPRPFERLAGELPPAPIAPAPEDMGVKVYAFRGRPCVIAAAVGRALGYASDGKGLCDLVGREWATEVTDGRDYSVLRFGDLREFKGLLEDTVSRTVSSAARLMVLYESGFDLVLQKTDKPEGQKLRRRLADEVLPKLRRGGPVQPVVSAPAFDPRELPRLMAEAMAQAMPAVIKGAVDILKPLMLPPGSQPAPAPEHPVPTGWLTHADLSERLPYTRRQIERLIRSAESIRDNPNLCRSKLIDARDGQRHQCFYYHPSIIDVVRRLAVGVDGALFQVDSGNVASAGTDIKGTGRPVMRGGV